MSYNHTYSQIKEILKSSPKISKPIMLQVARLAIVETLGDKVTADSIEWDTKFIEMDADSLDMVELVMFLEECFGIEIADESAGEIVTVGDAIEVIKKAKANKGKKKKINVSKYKKKANPDAPMTAATQARAQADAAAKKTEELEIEIEEALKEEE